MGLGTGAGGIGVVSFIRNPPLLTDSKLLQQPAPLKGLFGYRHLHLWRGWKHREPKPKTEFPS